MIAMGSVTLSNIIDGKDGEDGKDGVSIKSSVVEYAVGSSPTDPPGRELYTENLANPLVDEEGHQLMDWIWSITVPTVPDGYYLWSRTTITLDNENQDTSYSYSVAKSAPVIQTERRQYYLSTSSEALSGGSWVYEQPAEIPENKYLWGRFEFLMTDGSIHYSDAVYENTLGGVINLTNAIDKKITQKIWQTDITTKIDSYDNTVAKSIRDRITSTETDLDGIHTTISDMSSTIGDSNSGLIKKVNTIEETAEGHTQTIQNDILGNSPTSVKSIANQAADHFTWLVQSGGNASEFHLTQNAAEIIADEINLEGKVKFSSFDTTDSQTASLLDSLDSLSDFNVLNIITEYTYIDNPSNPATPPGSSAVWTSTPPTWQDGRYIWQRTTTTYKGSSEPDYQIVCLTGQKGATGSGINTASVYLYKRSSSTPTTKPTAILSYDFTNGSLTGNTNGWSTTIPSGTDPCYLMVTTVTSSNSTTNIQPSVWTNQTPVKFVENGAQGASGLNQATVMLYKRASSAPTAPSSNLTYQFSTGRIISGNLNGWSQSIPAVDGDKSCWAISAPAVGTGTNYTILSGAWTEPVSIIENGIGIKETHIYYGISGSGTEEPGRVLVNELGQPLKYDIGDNALLLNNVWQTEVPEVPDGLYLWTKTETIYTDDTSSVSYSAAKSGVSIASTKVLYNLSATKPSKDPLTDMTGWSLTPQDYDSTRKYWTCTITYFKDGTMTAGEIIEDKGLNTANERALAAYNKTLTAEGILQKWTADAKLATTTIDGGFIKTHTIQTEHLATDAIMSNNYSKVNSNKFSTNGSYFDLENGNIFTPFFFVVNTVPSGSGLIQGAAFKGAVEATSLTLGNNVQIDANRNIIGLSEVATSGDYSALLNKPDIPDKFSDLDDDVGFVQSNTVSVTQSTPDSNGIITTTSKIGNVQYTTYTAPNGRYLLTNVGKGSGSASTSTERNNNSAGYFYVDTNGLLTAKNALIYGSIHAGMGNIGGWTINTDALSYSSSTPSATSIVIAPEGKKSDASIAGNTNYGTGSGKANWVFTIKDKFGVESDGTLNATGAVIKGNITATNLTLDTNATFSATSGSGDNTTSYSMTSGGKLTAVNAEITGKITANTGAIGGWQIKPSSENYSARLYYGAENPASNSLVLSPQGITSTTSIGGWTASQNQQNKTWAFTIKNRFGVTTTGDLWATNVNLSGSINASGGSIGGFTINNTYISNGPESLSDTDHDGVYISSSGIYNYKKAVNQTPAKFVKITQGVITAQGATISGAITATSGSFTGDVTVGSDTNTNKIHINGSSTNPAIYYNIQAFNANNTSKGFYIGSDGIVIGKGFYVDEYGNTSIKMSGSQGSGSSAISWSFNVDGNGFLSASNASIDGHIVAETGNIGPWVINSTSISKQSSGNNAGTYGTENHMYFGDSGLSISNKFKVSSAGELTSTSGKIGPWQIISTAIYKGSDTMGQQNTSAQNNAYFGDDGLSISNKFKVDSGGNATVQGVISANTFNIYTTENNVDSSLTSLIKAEYVADTNNARVRIGQNGAYGTYITMCYANKTWTNGQALHDDYGKMKLSAKNGIYIVNDTSVEIDGNLSLIGSPGSGSEKWTITAPVVAATTQINTGVIDATGYGDNGRVIVKGNLSEDRGEVEAGDFYARNNYRIFYWKDSSHPNETVQCIESNTPSNFGSPKGISGTQKTWIRFGSTSSYNCMAMPVNGSSIYFRVKSSSDSSYTWYNLKTDIIDKLGTGGTSYSFNSDEFSISSSNVVSLKNSYATQTWVNNKGYITSSSLNGYATQTWVNNKGYATQTWVNNKNYSSVVYTNGTGSNSGEFTGVQSGVLYLACFHFDSAPNSTALYMFIGGKTKYQPIKSGSDIGITLTSSKFSWTDSAKSVRVRILSLG